MPTIELQVQSHTSYDKFSQPSPKEYIQGYIQDAHVRERDPVSQKEKCSTRELELVSLNTKELLVLGGWIHFDPSLGI